MNEYDLVVIGGGAAGFSAAIKADELGAKTLMVNDARIGLGGTCVNVGCVPTKYLLNVVKVLTTNRIEDFKGINISASFDFNKIIEEKDKLVQKLRKEKYERVLEHLENVSFMKGRAKFLSDVYISVDGVKIKGKRFIICTGSSTAVPTIKGLKDCNYITHIELLNLNYLPSSLIIIGGGPLAVEMGQIFSRFGTKVYIFKRTERILKKEEPELSNLLREYLENEGIEIYTNSKVLRVWQKSYRKFLEVLIGEDRRIFEADEILIATGRTPNTENLGLENTHIELGGRNEIVINAEMQATFNIWAAGDVTGEPMLETVAAREGMIAANNALSNKKLKMDYSVVPHAVFTDPQIASVGYTDLKAVRHGYSCKCNVVPMKLIPKAMIIKDTRGAIKIVIDKNTKKVLGIHILSPNAADIIHEGVMILRNQMTIDEIIESIHIFPTLSEAIKIGAQSFKKDVKMMSCCVE